METYMKNLGDYLNNIIGMEEYTIAEMADKCNISKRKLCEIVCREKKGIQFYTLVRISQALGTPISVLIGE